MSFSIDASEFSFVPKKDGNKKPITKYFGNFSQNSPNIWQDENRYVRSAATSTTLLPNNPLSNTVLTQNDPKRFIAVYNEEYNNRLANAWEFDYTIRGAINRLVFFVLGKTDSIKTTLYPNIREQISTEAESKNELSKVKIIRRAEEVADSIVGSQFSEQEQNQLQEYIDNTDRVTRLYSSLQKPLKSAYVFGRSGLWIERTPNEITDLNIPAGAPIALKPLNSRYLGQVRINQVNWNITDVEYKDPSATIQQHGNPVTDDLGENSPPPKQKDDQTNWLPISDLVYFTRDDDNIVGDSLHYGLSTLQPILALSEENRRINQRVMPELNESQWCGSALWTFPGWSEADINKFLATIKPAKNITVNSPDVSVEEIHLQFDYPSLLNLRESNSKIMLGTIGIPDFLMNIKASSAQKTMGDELIAFQESIVESERAWIRDILDEYWYRRLLQAYFPSDQYIHIKLKVVTEFKNISFESFFEKALALETLVSNKLLTPNEARELLSYPVKEGLDNERQDLGGSGLGAAPPTTTTEQTPQQNLDETQSRPPQTQLQNKASEKTATKRLTKPFK